jgi:opacity protein-like surface antigen
MRYYIGRKIQSHPGLIQKLVCAAVLLSTVIAADTTNNSISCACTLTPTADRSAKLGTGRLDSGNIQVAAMVKMRWEAKARALQQWSDEE